MSRRPRSCCPATDGAPAWSCTGGSTSGSSRAGTSNLATPPWPWPRIAALSRHRAPCRPEVDWHLDVQHVLVAADDAAPVVSPESNDVRWWDVDALPAELAPGVTENVVRAVRLLAEHG
jgi:hypothetical protein